MEDVTVQISIDGRRIEITPAIQEYLEQKLQKLKKYFPHVIDIHVVLFTQKYNQVVEITIKANRFTVHGIEKTNDLYASIDKVIEKLDKQLRKHKERLTKVHKRKSRKEKEREFNLNISVFDREEIEEIHPSPTVIHTRQFPAKPMTVDEAALQMDLNGHEFLVYRDFQSNQINVIYRRSDGHYGLIVPEMEA